MASVRSLISRTRQCQPERAVETKANEQYERADLDETNAKAERAVEVEPNAKTERAEEMSCKRARRASRLS